MSRKPQLRTTAVAIASAAVLIGGALPALAAAPTDPEQPIAFNRIDVDTNLSGAAFSSAGDVFADPAPAPVKQELVVTSYGPFVGQLPTVAGKVQVYRQGASINEWTKSMVFDQSEDLYVPNQPTIVDVNEDGANDIIMPSGYFFDSGGGNDRGAVTWWENKGVDQSWVRHDVITDSPWAYHGVQYVDLDGDEIKDIVTSGEQGFVAADSSDDVVQTVYFKGAIDELTDERTFGPAIVLSPKGGSLPVVDDVDKDGSLDIITAQYFGTLEPSYVWLERVGDPTSGALTSANFVTHTISTAQGTAFQIRKVPDFRGDGVDRWVGTNHQTYNGGLYPTVDGGVFELNPGSDITAPWTPTTLAGPFHPRSNYGQGAPGVFGHGDLDGDGDVDLALSGDGDRRLFWIEQTGTGAFETHVLSDYEPSDPNKPGFGQAGGAIVSDLDSDGKDEMAFSSYDRNAVAVWQRYTVVPPTVTTVTSSLKLAGVPATKAGAKVPLTIDLTAASGGPARSVKVTFKADRTGTTTPVGTVALGVLGGNKYRGTLNVTSRESGRFTATYAGATVSSVLKDSAASATAKLTTRSTVTGFKSTKAKLSKKKTFTDGVTVSPGFNRTVKLQSRTCAPAKKSCSWKTVKSYRSSTKGAVTLKYTPKKGTTYWRVSVASTKAGTATVSKVRTVKRS